MMEFGILVPGFSVCSIQCLHVVVQVQKNFQFGRLVPGSDEVKISHWQAGCRISSKTTSRIILGIGQNIPLNV